MMSAVSCQWKRFCCCPSYVSRCDELTPPWLQVIDDLDEIHFTMKKARQVIRDMTRSLMTDK